MSNPSVLHSSEGQKIAKPASVVSRCWPWLQVIKALLSFCQSSDSSNISACLISAVSSIRAYTKPWKDQHLVPVFAIRSSNVPSRKADLDLSWHYLLVLRQRSRCHFLTLIEAREFIVPAQNSTFCHSLGSTPRTLNHRRVASGRCHLSNPLRLLQPRKNTGTWRCDRGGFRPATGLQVSPSRLEGVRQNRMMAWLIQQHLHSSGMKRAAVTDVMRPGNYRRCDKSQQSRHGSVFKSCVANAVEIWRESDWCRRWASRLFCPLKTPIHHLLDW